MALKQPPPATPAAHRAAIVKLLRSFGYRHHANRVFSDAVEQCAISLAVLDIHRRASREERFAQIESAYSEEERAQFPKLLGHLTMALEAEPGDVLGSVFCELDLGNDAAGQFFTPYEVSRAMAQVIIGDGGDVRRLIEDNGFITVNEPACGAGSMVIAFAMALRDAGINYQRHLHVTAVDVDARAAHMAFVQLSLLHSSCCRHRRQHADAGGA